MTKVLDHWHDPVFNETHRQVPAVLATRLTEMADEISARHIYYERLHVLLALSAIAELTNPAAFQTSDAPTDNEKQLGSVIGQAFHEGCPLADVALAAGLPPEQVVAIGKRTIRRTNWLKRL